MKKSSAGSTGKSGAGFGSKSGKTGSTFGTGKSTFGSSGKSSGFSSKNTFGSSKSSAFGSGGKSPTSSPSAKSPSFMPLGTSGKDKSYSPKEKKSTMPLLLGGKTTSAFASSPSKSHPSTSFASPKKSKTTFGIIWIPRKKHNKKEYVHVSHNNDGYKERSPSMYPHEHNFMSGDSSSHPFKKKDEDNNLFVLDRPKGPIATAASAGATVLAANDKNATQDMDTNFPEVKQDNPDVKKQDEKQEHPELKKEDKQNGEDTKEAAGDADFDDDKDNKSFLENESSKFTDTKPPKDRGDKVDSVYLRPPPPHKVRSNTSTTDEDDCGIKCLYYTLQCCDCVLM